MKLLRCVNAEKIFEELFKFRTPTLKALLMLMCQAIQPFLSKIISIDLFLLLKKCYLITLC